MCCWHLQQSDHRRVRLYCLLHGLVRQHPCRDCVHHVRRGHLQQRICRSHVAGLLLVRRRLVRHQHQRVRRVRRWRLQQRCIHPHVHRLCHGVVWQRACRQHVCSVHRMRRGHVQQPHHGRVCLHGLRRGRLQRCDLCQHVKGVHRVRHGHV